MHCLDQLHRELPGSALAAGSAALWMGVKRMRARTHNIYRALLRRFSMTSYFRRFSMTSYFSPCLAASARSFCSLLPLV